MSILTLGDGKSLSNTDTSSYAGVMVLGEKSRRVEDIGGIKSIYSKTTHFLLYNLTVTGNQLPSHPYVRKIVFDNVIFDHNPVLVNCPLLYEVHVFNCSGTVTVRNQTIRFIVTEKESDKKCYILYDSMVEAVISKDLYYEQEVLRMEVAARFALDQSEALQKIEALEYKVYEQYTVIDKQNELMDEAEVRIHGLTLTVTKLMGGIDAGYQ